MADLSSVKALSSIRINFEYLGICVTVRMVESTIALSGNFNGFVKLELRLIEVNFSFSNNSILLDKKIGVDHSTIRFSTNVYRLR